MSAVIETEKLVKTYRTGKVETQALRGIDMRVEEGEFLAIVGPSGSGKSTLLNLLGALDKPTSGKVRIDGVDISRLNDNQLAELRNRTQTGALTGLRHAPTGTARTIGMALVRRNICDRINGFCTAIGRNA